MLADVFVPEGTIIAGLGQLLLSLMNTPSSPSSPAPMTPSSVVEASSLGDELAQCTANTYSVNADVSWAELVFELVFLKQTYLFKL